MNCSTNTESYSCLKKQFHDQTAVELKLSGGDEIAEIVSVCPQICCTGAEVTSGAINYTGRLILTAVYLGTSGKLCRMQKGIEFSHTAHADDLTPSNTANCKFSCVATKTKREGSEYVVTTVIDADICVFEQTERSVMISAEGAICKTEEVTFYAQTPFSGESEVEDDFTAEGIEDILSDRVGVLVTKCEINAGEAYVEGELLLALVGLRGDMPVFLERTIPFKSTFQCGSVTGACTAFCNAQIKDLSVNVTVNEDSAKCKIELAATMEFFGYAVEKNVHPAVIDAYICGNECSLTYATECVKICDEIRVFSERVSGLCAMRGKVDYTCIFKAVVEPKVEYTLTDGNLEGVVSATLLYLQSGNLHGMPVSLPFSVSFERASRVSNLQITVGNISLRQRAEGECEAEAQLRISACVCTEQSVRYVTDIACGEKKQDGQYAFSVYLVREGESLWDIAKRMSIPPDEVERTHPGYTYPLTGKERFTLYRIKTN